MKVNTLRPRQNGRHFADDIFKCIFLNENVSIAIKISLKFVPKGPISNIPSLVQIMAWRRPGDKPLSEPMMARLPTHICVTRPQWVKSHLVWLVFWPARPPSGVCWHPFLSASSCTDASCLQIENSKHEQMLQNIQVLRRLLIKDE